MASVEPLPDIYGTSKTTDQAPTAYTTSDVEKNAPPPSYESIFGKVKRARTETTNKASFSRRVCRIFCETYGCLIILSGMLVIPISMIVMGAVYLHDCRAYNFLPIYLIVYGVFLAITFTINIIYAILQKKKEREGKPVDKSKEKKDFCQSCIDPIIQAFLFCWFIRGAILVYSLQHTWKSSPSTSDDYCNPVLFYYSFWVITAHFIAVGVIILGFVLFGVIAKKIANSK